MPLDHGYPCNITSQLLSVMPKLHITIESKYTRKFLKIVNLKREQGLIFAIKSKEARSRSCTSQHWLMQLIITYHHSCVQYKQLLVKSTKFIPTLYLASYTFSFPTKVVINLLVFVLCPDMFVGNNQLHRLANAGQCMIYILLPYFVCQ